MSLHMTEEEYREYVNRNAKVPPMKKPTGITTCCAPSRRKGVSLDEMEENPKRNKYGNERVDLDGHSFDSRHEAKVYADLRVRGLSGEFKGIARQATFFLPGGVKYIADFVTLNTDGTYTVIDAKSEATRKNAVYRLKKKQMKNCLGLDIVEV